VVVSVIEITTIVLLVMVGRAKSLMARMIRHDAIVRKGVGGGRREAGGGRRLAQAADEAAEKASRFLDLVLKCFKRDDIEEAEPTGQEQMGFDFR
jgi:hypothetical protein